MGWAVAVKDVARHGVSGCKYYNEAGNAEAGRQEELELPAYNSGAGSAHRAKLSAYNCVSR